MKLPLTYLILTMTILACSCGGKKPLPTRIDFETDIGVAMRKAEQSGKPMIIDFYTDWCKWCDSLDANTYVDPVVIAMSVDNIFVKINAEIDIVSAERFQVSGFPTVVVAKSNGEEIDRIWGYLPPTDFYNQVQLYFQGKETLEDYLIRLGDEPENPAYLQTVGEKYASRSNFDQAIGYFRKITDLDSDDSNEYGLKAWESIYDTQARARDYDGAVATCLEITRRFPGTPEAIEAESMIGYYISKKGDNKEALAAYREFLKNHSDSQNAGWVKDRIADLEDML